MEVCYQLNLEMRKKEGNIVAKEIHFTGKPEREGKRLLNRLNLFSLSFPFKKPIKPSKIE